jgi:tripartite-type tricarboxylate transporter receptor subunit TctC
MAMGSVVVQPGDLVVGAFLPTQEPPHQETFMNPMTPKTVVSRRSAIVAALAFAGVQSHAQQDAIGDYPNKVVKIIVPYSVGSGADLLARFLSERLAPTLGQALVVENKAGASGVIGTAAVAAAPADGYTLMIAPPTHVITSVLRKTSYDPIKDFEPIAQVARGVFVLAVHPATPAASLKELVAHLKTQGSNATYASAGVGSTTHLYMAHFQMEMGTQMRHVPAKGVTASLMDVMQNLVTVVLAPLETVAPLLAGGRLKAVAQTGRARQPGLPNVPTFAEAGAPDYNVELWFGMYAPAGTPRAVVARLNREINAVLATADAKALLAHQGLEPVTGTPELLGGLGKAEFARWSAVVKSAGIKAE